MAKKIYIPKSLGIYNPPRATGIFGTAIDTDTLDLANWITEAAADGTITIAGGGGGAVSSVSGRTGAVVLTKTDVGLSNVDNTSDVNKPVSTAQATAIALKASQTQVTALQTLTGVASGVTTLAPFTGGVITQTAIKSVLQELSDAIVTVSATANAKQDKVQWKGSGTNVSTLGTITKVNIIGGTVVVNGSDPTQLDFSVPSGGTTTNALTGNTASGIVSTVNGQVATLTPATGTIATQLGFDATGAIVKAIPTVSSGIQTVVNNGASIKYFVVSGTPVVTFTKASGITQVVATGGVIEVMRVQVNFDTTADTDATKSITVKVPTTQSGTMIQVPVIAPLNTQNGSTPATTAWLYKNPGSTPTTSVVDGVAGSYVTIKSTGTDVVGTTATLVLNF